MRWFQNLKTGVKLALGFGLCLTLALVVGVIALTRMAQIGHITEQMAHNEKMSNLTERLTTGVLRYHSAQKSHMLSTTDADKGRYANQMRQLSTGVNQDVSSLKKLVRTESGRNLVKVVEEAWPQYEAVSAKVVALSNKRQAKAAQALSSHEGRPLVDQIEKTFDDYTAQKEQQGEQDNKMTQATVGSSRNTVVGMLGVAILFGVLAAWFITRLIVGALTKMAAAANGLAVGDIDQQITVDSKDEIGDMARSFQAMIDYQKEMAAVAEAMAVGDIFHSIQPKSDKDMFGRSFQALTSYQREMAGTAEAMANGDASRTVKPKSDKDVFGNAFASLIAYQKEMAAVAAAMAQGDISRSVQPKSDKDVFGHAFVSLVAYQKEMAEVAEAMAGGDLSRSIQPKSDQDTLGNAFARMIHSLSQLVGKARVAADSIAAASSQVASGSEDLSQRTTEQASSLEETASSMEEMTSTVKQNADNARHANQLAAQAREMAQEGGKVVSDAVSSMQQINGASKRIADIISVIDEIAFQTNLLALNAAVEAARVGEQGKGFAVVAAEVRNLAGRSATAAKEIKALVADSVSKVAEGSTLVNRSGEQLEEIVSSVKKVADIIAEIAAASTEQAAGIEQVNKAIMQMDQITQENAALVEEASASSQAMTSQAQELARLVSAFKLEASYLSGLQAEEVRNRAALVEQASRVLSATGTDGGDRGGRGARRGGSSKTKLSLSVSNNDKDHFEEF